MKWYSHDPAAFLEGVIGLDAEERGFYITIIDLYYARDGKNLTDELICQAMACRPQTWRRVKISLMAKGKLNANLVPNSCETRLKLAQNRIERMSELGTISAQNRAKSKADRQRPVATPPSVKTTTREEEEATASSSSSLVVPIERTSAAEPTAAASAQSVATAPQPGALPPSPPASPSLTPNPTQPPHPLREGMSPDQGLDYRSPPPPKPPEHQHQLQNLDQLLAKPWKPAGTRP